MYESKTRTRNWYRKSTRPKYYWRIDRNVERTSSKNRRTMIVHKIFPTAVLEFDLSDNPVVQNIKELIDKKESIQASEHGLIDHGVS